MEENRVKLKNNLSEINVNYADLYFDAINIAELSNYDKVCHFVSFFLRESYVLIPQESVYWINKSIYKKYNTKEEVQHYIDLLVELQNMWGLNNAKKIDNDRLEDIVHFCKMTVRKLNEINKEEINCFHAIKK